MTETAKERGCDTVCKLWKQERTFARSTEDALVREQTTFHDALECVAKAAGIQTGRASWWDTPTEVQVDTVVARVKFLRKEARDE